MTRRLMVLVGRYAVDLIVCGLALASLIEDLVKPIGTLSGFQYDRGREVVLIPVLVVVVGLVYLRRRLGVIGPLGAIVLIGLSSLSAPTWVPSSAWMYLLVLVLSGVIGFMSTLPTAPATAAVVIAVSSFAVARQPDRSWDTWIFVTLFLLMAWGAGFLIRRPVEKARQAEERARQLELEGRVAADEAVAHERHRIARELHDVIAHSVSVMTVQTSAVRRLLLPEQEKEREALLSVESTGRQALTEMRRLVGLLKEDSVMTPYAPQPSMTTLESLLSTVREAGLPVELAVEGVPRPLPPAVDLAAYRVVQEALTNALKHAGTAQAWVTVRWAGDEIEVQVENDGTGDGDARHGGHGLVGMRERVGVVGGSLESGRRAAGGFVVSARLPVGGTS